MSYDVLPYWSMVLWPCIFTLVPTGSNQESCLATSRISLNPGLHKTHGGRFWMECYKKLRKKKWVIFEHFSNKVSFRENFHVKNPTSVTVRHTITKPWFPNFPVLAIEAWRLLLLLKLGKLFDWMGVEDSRNLDRLECDDVLASLW